MTLRRAELIGGPLDGHQTAPRSLPFVWAAPAGGQVRVFDRPGPGRLLYRSEDAGWKLVFVGYTHMVCPGCELVQPTGGACALCGQVLIPL